MTADISGLAGSTRIVEFALSQGTEAAVSTTVTLDNVVLRTASGGGNVIPEPTTLAIFSVLGIFLAPSRRRGLRQAAK